MFSPLAGIFRKRIASVDCDDVDDDDDDNDTETASERAFRMGGCVLSSDASYDRRLIGLFSISNATTKRLLAPMTTALFTSAGEASHRHEATTRYYTREVGAIINYTRRRTDTHTHNNQLISGTQTHFRNATCTIVRRAVPDNCCCYAARRRRRPHFRLLFLAAVARPKRPSIFGRAARASPKHCRRRRLSVVSRLAARAIERSAAV